MKNLIDSWQETGSSMEYNVSVNHFHLTVLKGKCGSFNHLSALQHIWKNRGCVSYGSAQESEIKKIFTSPEFQT